MISSLSRAAFVSEVRQRANNVAEELRNEKAWFENGFAAVFETCCCPVLFVSVPCVRVSQ